MNSIRYCPYVLAHKCKCFDEIKRPLLGVIVSWLQHEVIVSTWKAFFYASSAGGEDLHVWMWGPAQRRVLTQSACLVWAIPIKAVNILDVAKESFLILSAQSQTGLVRDVLQVVLPTEKNLVRLWRSQNLIRQLRRWRTWPQDCQF